MTAEQQPLPQQQQQPQRRFSLICSNCHKTFGYSNGLITEVVDNAIHDFKIKSKDLPYTSWALFCLKCKDTNEREQKV